MTHPPLRGPQAAGLTQSLAALGPNPHPAHIAHCARLWGATPDEAHTLLEGTPMPTPRETTHAASVALTTGTHAGHRGAVPQFRPYIYRGNEPFHHLQQGGHQ